MKLSTTLVYKSLLQLFRIQYIFDYQILHCKVTTALVQLRNLTATYSLEICTITHHTLSTFRTLIYYKTLTLIFHIAPTTGSSPSTAVTSPNNAVLLISLASLFFWFLSKERSRQEEDWIFYYTLYQQYLYH